jgi:hypothetical protein
MKRNKRGFATNSMVVVLLFMFVAVVAIGITAILQETATDFLFKPVVEQSQNMYDDGQISNQINEHSITIFNRWLEFDWKPDLFFFASLLFSIVTTIRFAIKSRKLGWWSFSGYVTIGSMGFLFVSSIMINITQQFYDLIFNQMLESWTLSTPIFNWFMVNSGWFTFLWFVVLLLINQIEFSITDPDLKKEDFFDE